MNRRELLIGSAAAAWPVGAWGQQGERVRRIGVILPAIADDPVFQAWFGAFLQQLALLGWTIGQNVRVDTRWASSNAADIRRHAAEVVALAPDVILAYGASTVAPILQATRAIPVVFPVVGDPVGAELCRLPGPSDFCSGSARLVPAGAHSASLRVPHRL